MDRLGLGLSISHAAVLVLLACAARVAVGQGVGDTFKTTPPDAAEELLRLIGRLDHSPDDKAVAELRQLWARLGQEQKTDAIRNSLAMSLDARPRYPRGIDPAIRAACHLRDGSVARLLGLDRKQLNTELHHYIDDQPREVDRTYFNEGATGGWFHLGDLPVGRHGLRLETAFSFNEGDQLIRGVARSPVYEIEIVEIEAFEALAARLDDASAQAIANCIVIATPEHGGTELARDDRPAQW